MCTDSLDSTTMIGLTFDVLYSYHNSMNKLRRAHVSFVILFCYTQEDSAQAVIPLT